MESESSSWVRVIIGEACCVSLGIASISWLNKVRKGMGKFANVVDNFNLTSSNVIDGFLGSFVEVFGNLSDLWSMGFMLPELVPVHLVVLNLSPVKVETDLSIVGGWLIDLDSHFRWRD